MYCTYDLLGFSPARTFFTASPLSFYSQINTILNTNNNASNPRSWKLGTVNEDDDDDDDDDECKENQ